MIRIEDCVEGRTEMEKRARVVRGSLVSGSPVNIKVGKKKQHRHGSSRNANDDTRHLGGE